MKELQYFVTNGVYITTDLRLIKIFHFMIIIEIKQILKIMLNMKMSRNTFKQ